MKKKTLKLFVTIAAAAALLLSVFTGAVSAEPAAGWNQLQDVWILKNFKEGQWSGPPASWNDRMAIEVAPDGSTLPLDETETYDGLPSYRVNVTGSGGWWTSLLAHNNWSTYNLEQYYNTDGVLEFNIKGAAGGENFTIGLRSRENEHTPAEVEVTKPIAEFAAVTTEWQHVAIPLKSLIPSNSGFALKQGWLVTMGNATGNPVKFWINSIKFSSSGPEKTYPAIKVNQVGYTPISEKYALVSGFWNELPVAAGSAYQVRRSADQSVAFEGKLSLVTEFDPIVSGEKVLKADFSYLTQPGSYYVSVDGLDRSPVFKVANDVFASLLTDTARYFYLQRSGIALDAAHAGVWAHGVGHPQDTAVKLRSQQNNPNAATIDVSGGWYDAGDFGKYTNAGATAVSDLLWTHEMFGWQFTDGQLNIPESGNGVPDLLDEIKYELDFLLKMQDPASGGFYHMVMPQGGCNCTPDNIHDPRYIEDVTSAGTNIKPTGHTGSVVGALAHASLVFKPYDKDYSKQLLAAAEKGWKYLADHPEVIVSPSGPYYDNEDASDRQYAAAALLRATGNPIYRKFFEDNYTKFAGTFDSPENAHGVGSMAHIAFLHYMSADKPDKTVAKWYKDKFKHWRDEQVNRAQTLPWHNTLDDGHSLSYTAHDYYWGSNMAALNTTLVLAVGSKTLGNIDKSVLTVAWRNLNYVLGVNPLRFSYVSGYGEDSVNHIFSGIYSNDGKPGMPPGYMAGGANAYEGKHFSKFAGKAYNDVDSEWTTNEHTIYWNSGLLFSVALANSVKIPK